MTPADVLRADLRLVADLVPAGSRVLDLGCGDGALLAHLRDRRSCTVRGVELSEEGVASCVARGLSVVQADLDAGLRDLPDYSADVVVLSQTLQVVRDPRLVINEMMRVGHRGVVSYPNFAQLSSRVRLGVEGRMPVSAMLPYQWYDTPNIHLTTIKDFRAYCAADGLTIERELALDVRGDRATPVRALPNLRANLAIAVITREV
ncbi:MAG: methionine biosynthesis protein MetW [Coriobacteriia bacterium]